LSHLSVSPEKVNLVMLVNMSSSDRDKLEAISELLECSVNCAVRVAIRYVYADIIKKLSIYSMKGTK
jgi:hypothetical protein